MGNLCDFCCKKTEPEVVRRSFYDKSRSDTRPLSATTTLKTIDEHDDENSEENNHTERVASSIQIAAFKPQHCYVRISKELFIKQNQENPCDNYSRIEFLGEGGFAKVFKVKYIKTDEIRAMKIIKKHMIEDGIESNKIFDEIAILKKLDHPNIIKIYEFFEDIDHFYLISEFCKFGDLYSNLLDSPRQKVFTEKIIWSIMKQLLIAINYLHSQGVLHSDLKLENILVDRLNLDSKNNIKEIEIKVIDFGCSMFFKNKQILSENVYGTINYIAPEAFEGIINKKNDIWACGIIMYIIITGEFPYDGKDLNEIVKEIEENKIDFNEKLKKLISSEAIDLLKNLLTYDYKKRVDANTALKHKWFKKVDSSIEVDKSLKNEIMNNIINYKNDHQFQMAVSRYITYNLITKDNVENLRKIFKSLDTNGKGRISKKDLQNGFKELTGSNLDEIKIQEIMNSLDHDQSGFIEYEEFIQAALGEKNILTEENLKNAFDMLDIDKSGDISVEEILKIFGGGENGMGINKDNLKTFLEEINIKEEDTINYRTFKNLLKSAKKHTTSKETFKRLR